MRGGREAMQKQHGRRLGVTGLAIEHLQSIERGGAVNWRHGESFPIHIDQCLDRALVRDAARWSWIGAKLGFSMRGESKPGSTETVQPARTAVPHNTVANAADRSGVITPPVILEPCCAARLEPCARQTIWRPAPLTS